MDLTLVTVIALVALALLFDYTNGFHDSANSVATIVATRVLKPRIAVLWAAGFNFIAFAVFGTKVADTIGSVVKPGTVGLAVVFAALFGALVWNFVTWYVGLPSSSSHALIGGLERAWPRPGRRASRSRRSRRRCCSWCSRRWWAWRCRASSCWLCASPSG